MLESGLNDSRTDCWKGHLGLEGNLRYRTGTAGDICATGSVFRHVLSGCKLDRCGQHGRIQLLQHPEEKHSSQDHIPLPSLQEFSRDTVQPSHFPELKVCRSDKPDSSWYGGINSGDTIQNYSFPLSSHGPFGLVFFFRSRFPNNTSSLSMRRSLPIGFPDIFF